MESISRPLRASSSLTFKGWTEITQVTSLTGLFVKVSLLNSPWQQLRREQFPQSLKASWTWTGSDIYMFETISPLLYSYICMLTYKRGYGKWTFMFLFYKIKISREKGVVILTSAKNNTDTDNNWSCKQWWLGSRTLAQIVRGEILFWNSIHKHPVGFMSGVQ